MCMRPVTTWYRRRSLKFIHSFGATNMQINCGRAIQIEAIDQWADGV